MQENEIIAENERRKAVLFAEYDPILGIGSPIDRFPLLVEIQQGVFLTYLLPLSMKGEEIVILLQSDPSIKNIAKKLYGQDDEVHQQKIFTLFVLRRFKHDFEFWAFVTAKIQDKETKKVIRFKQRLAQRILFKELEDMRCRGVPIRLILLKARQYGGSTLIQIYMLWIQTELMENWHSAICALDEGQARNIRGMYSRAAKEYPLEIGTITLVPYQGSAKNKMVRERGCIIGIGSMEKPDNLRSYDFSMIHLSEVGLFRETQGKKPEDLVQTLRSALPALPMTMEVLESTAKGVGNFFHREWLDAKDKKSGYKAVFVPWFMIDIYQKPIEDKLGFIKSLNPYEHFLWNSGAILEGIYWYRTFKSDNRYSDWRMAAEFPSNDLEAFQSTGSRVFAPEYVQQMRKFCCPPEFIGKLYAKGRKGKEAFENLEFHASPEGELWIWSMPDKSIEVENRYIVAVDIGGRSEKADYSTVKVLDRYGLIDNGASEVVAAWKGHLDQDLFSWVAVQIARFYNNALFIVETNSLRKEIISSEGDHYLTVLDEIAEYYDNIYARTSPQKVNGNIPVLWGLHMGQNKTMIIDSYNGALRDMSYIERDMRTLDECDTYEYKPDGTMGAVDGCHDDLVIVSAICVWASETPLAIGPVREISRSQRVVRKKIVNESSI